MSAPDPITRKLDAAVASASAAHPDEIKGMMVIGSVTHERTTTSDLDVSVVFEDAYYETHARDLRHELAALAVQINEAVTGPELVLWASKADHFLTLFPDVSYVRANLPTADERLDAWCGLAKHTLHHYEEATAQPLWGDPGITSHWRIPAAEAVELFMLATRTIVEGLAEAQSAHRHERQMGNNHVAKGVMRAVYATLVAEQHDPCNSYAAIQAAGAERLSEPLRASLAAAYRAKSDGDPLLEAVSLDDVLELLVHCETVVASAPRWRIGGLVPKPGDEGFSFDPKALVEARPVEQYSRWPDARENYVQSSYFLITAPLVADRLARVPVDAALADFYFEELAAVAVHALLHRGLTVAFGSHDAELVHRPISLATVQAVAAQLERAAEAYLEDRSSSFSRPWLGLDQKLARAAALLVVVGQAPGVSTSDALLERLHARVGNDLFDGIVWVCEIAGSQFSKNGLKLLADLGLSLYQGGDLERARRVLTRAAELARMDVGDADAELDAIRSKAVHHLGVTAHREGRLEEAVELYGEALDRDPENVSALDDLANVLSAHTPPEQAGPLLLDRFNRVKANVPLARESVVGQVMNRAIDLKQAREFEAAEKWYRLTLEVAPDLPSAWLNLGLLLVEVNRPHEARRQFARALELDPDYEKAAYWLGVLVAEPGGPGW